jgi:hypothetical protein
LQEGDGRMRPHGSWNCVICSERHAN